jgi:hypothetical protein
MGNYIYAAETPLDDNQDDPLLWFPTSHVNRIKKKHIRLEKDLVLINSQMGYNKRTLTDKFVKSNKALEDIHEESLDVKRLNNDLVKKLERSNRLLEYANNDKQLAQSQCSEIENQLRIAKANNAQAHKIFAKKSKLLGCKNTDKFSSFFDNRNEHILTLEKQTAKTSIPRDLRRSLITQTFNYAEEHMFN